MTSVVILPILMFSILAYTEQTLFSKLFMLQTRNGKRTAQAALQIACDLVDEGVIDQCTAVLRVGPKQLDTLLHPQFEP